MRANDVKRELDTVLNVLYKDYGLLDNASANSIAKSKAGLSSPPRGTNWRLQIARDSPIRFRECAEKRNSLSVDVFGSIEEPTHPSEGLGSHPPTLSGALTIRVWSRKVGHYYREGVDAIEIKQRVEENAAGTGRVLTRFHFERAESTAIEPLYHLQVGGRLRDDEEFCWYPEWLKLPRFVHHPLNLILACEFVVANFFPDEYSKIREEPLWRKWVEVAQEEYVFHYYEAICRCRNKKESILHLLCSPGQRLSILQNR